ncbi:hypothetical protein GM3708_19 [Geminocystis sp. NIES-3708]|nr:DUF4277 domain-containing protein [Geminocystis sp. NIES-3708]BAQ59614.1 hypothetical protein GM3708_19 [Geminocystis sp. NIES-3708]
MAYIFQQLYLFFNFFRDKPVEKLLEEKIKAEEINDDQIR